MDTSNEKFYQGLGRRKTSISSVRLYVSTNKDHKITVNGKVLKDYFTTFELYGLIREPLQVIKNTVFDIEVKVVGGGNRGQAEATRLGLARAIVNFNSDFKKELKDYGYLTRDARKVERKKPGLKKARRAPQFSKR